MNRELILGVVMSMIAAGAGTAILQLVLYDVVKKGWCLTAAGVAAAIWMICWSVT